MEPNPLLPDSRLAAFLYRWRWPLTLLTVALIGLAFAQGGGRVAGRTSALASLGDASNGSGVVPPLVFDPTMDIWFGEEDAAVSAFYEIEDRFVAEDFVMVTFEVPDAELGVFDPDALATIARLTERFLTIPGVRHVRSLTYNPWIRWGEIEDELGVESGLIISDLVEGDPRALSEAEIVERMVAVLGAERAAQRVGEERVRAALGPDASFDDAIGEPLLLGTIVDDAGATTAIQVQVLRPRVEEELIAEAFAEDATARETGAAMYSIQVQRAALRGIQHHLRDELGLAVATPEFERLRAEVEAQPEGQEKAAALLTLGDPTKNFLTDDDGQLVRKYFEYEPDGSGGYVDRSDPAAPVQAPADFRPSPRSSYAYHLGGVPLFELNFEEVGMADARYIPLMFLVIIVLLLLVFRGVAGVVLPLLVIFLSVGGMLGLAFGKGDLLNNLTMMSPNMLTAVGLADAVHLIASWVALRTKFDDKRELITEVVRRNALPVLLTSLTTAVGFYSLTISKLAPVTMLGYTAGTGAVLAYLLSMTLVPAGLSLLPHRPGAARRPSRLAAFFTEERSDRMVRSLLRRRRPILAGAIGLAVLSAVGLARVEIDTDFRGMFPDDNPTMSDFHWIESRMGGVGDLELVFAGAPGIEAPPALTAAEDARLAELRLRERGASEAIEELTALTPAEAGELADLAQREAEHNAARIGVSSEFLAQLDAFEARLRAEMDDPESDLAVVTDLLSPLDILRKMHQVQNENRAEHYRVPGESDVAKDARVPRLEFDEWMEEWSLTPAQSGATLTAQYYLQYENGARPGENLTTQLSADRSLFRMQGRVVQASSAEHRAAFARIEEIAASEFPELGANLVTDFGEEPLSGLTISGKTLLFARTSHLFTVGFIQSMTIALVLITLLIGGIFRSVRLALASLVPNVLPIVLPLSAFGLLGIPIHGPAILVSSVALGVCVDDTIHLLTKFTRARRAGRSVEQALSYVLQEAGAAITITTVVLVIGFGTLLLSDFTPNFMMGTLAGLMITLAWIFDLLVTPAVLSYLSPEEEPTPSAEPASTRPVLAS
ncbi:MAG: MMPL family transporter [Planctomycetota bacterium]